LAERTRARVEGVWAPLHGLISTRISLLFPCSIPVFFAETPILRGFSEYLDIFRPPFTGIYRWTFAPLKRKPEMEALHSVAEKAILVVANRTDHAESLKPTGVSHA
jgi:hypothetical protein